MKAAIAGCGEMGWAHARGYRNNGVLIAAVCDTDGEKAGELAAFAGCRAYADLEEMLEREEVDCLSICTPPFHHASAMKAASRFGCAILCEKPFVLNAGELDEAIAAIRHSGRPFRIGFKFRYEGLYRAAREAVAAGEIGEVQYVLISHFQPIPPRLWKMQAGIVKELLVHACDMACCLLDGFPTALSLEAESRLRDFEGDDRALLTLHFGPGRKAVLIGGYMEGFSRDPARLAKNDIAFQAVGEKGYVAGLRNGDVTLCNAQGVSIWRPSEERSAFDLEMEEFCRAARGEDSNGPSLREAVASQLILEQAYQARNSGTARPLTVPGGYGDLLGTWVPRQALKGQREESR